MKFQGGFGFVILGIQKTNKKFDSNNGDLHNIQRLLNCDTL